MKIKVILLVMMLAVQSPVIAGQTNYLCKSNNEANEDNLSQPDFAHCKAGDLISFRKHIWVEDFCDFSYEINTLPKSPDFRPKFTCMYLGNSRKGRWPK